MRIKKNQLGKKLCLAVSKMVVLHQFEFLDLCFCWSFLRCLMPGAPPAVVPWIQMVAQAFVGVSRIKLNSVQAVHNDVTVPASSSTFMAGSLGWKTYIITFPHEAWRGSLGATTDSPSKLGWRRKKREAVRLNKSKAKCCNLLYTSPHSGEYFIPAQRSLHLPQQA